MALPIICPRCGIHNPPENRWCDCGYDLDLLPKLMLTRPSLDQAPPQQHHSRKKDTAPVGKRSRWEEGKDYVIKHWRGELPLGLSFWVSYMAINVGALLFFLKAPSYIFSETSLFNAQLRLAVLYFSFFLLSPWQVVGLWRSAENRILAKRAVFLPRFAQVICVIMAVMVLWSSLSIFEWTGMVFRDGAYAYTATVVDHPEEQFYEVLLNGFIGPGLADKLEDELLMAPRASFVTLNLVGGLLVEAKKMSESIAKRELSTYVGSHCDSACTYAFLAGSNRILHSEAKLGFHSASWIGVDWFTDKTREANKDWMTFLRQRGVRSEFIEKVFSVPSTEMWYPSLDELIQAGVVTHTYDGSQFLDQRQGGS